MLPTARQRGLWAFRPYNAAMSDDAIHIHGARQNNLKSLDLRLPLNELIVITGVSGSGKSSLAFDTVYAEGQRRYVETFSPYARQFLDRMDRPQVERIEGIPPAIAIDQVNPVRTSRSTVGTMTELNDHIKLLFARAAVLYCRGCAEAVRHDSPDSIADALLGRARAGQMAVITFSVSVPKNFSAVEVTGLLAQQGYTKIFSERETVLEVIQDRVRLNVARRDRLVEALEAALQAGHGKVTVYPIDAAREPGAPWRYSAGLHCARCDITYQGAQPHSFSFNSPLGACETCRGFGRTIGIDYGLVIPDETKTLAAGAVKPWQTASYKECQDDMLRYAKQRGIPVDVPWRKLSAAQQAWVIDGEGEWEDKRWYGARRYFAWLESKSYKMHIRVLLSKYRAYNTCETCGGARLQTLSLLWRLGSRQEAAAVLAPQARFLPYQVNWTREQLAALPGLSMHDVMLLPLQRCQDFFLALHLPVPLDEAVEVLLGEIRSRLRYLVEVGLGYLTLDRQSRTLSGGEVQRINLTTALGTSLVNTLFVLDEPSIGLHSRDMQRIIAVLRRLRDVGNSLLVVEHDPQVMWEADRIIDIGPGPGERGGEIVFSGTPAQLCRAKDSLTAQYLTGKKSLVRTREPRAPAKDGPRLSVRGASAHNLQHLDVDIPLQRLVCLTGVSGSGKSTLMQDVLYHALAKRKGKPVEMPGAHESLRGDECIDAVVLVDQSPIGKTTRSNPASYVGALDGIRTLFAAEPLARERGYTAGTFSFNAGNGRCPTCMGSGYEHVEMQFLSDVYLRCPDCDGRRYRAEVLEVRLWPLVETTSHARSVLARGTHQRAPARRGEATHDVFPYSASPPGRGAVRESVEGRAKSIAEVLDMTVAEAMEFFSHTSSVVEALRPLHAVGLDYLKLGQPVPTLSGGEAQRLKLAGHLAKARGGTQQTHGSLFLFDEPTTGLHFADIDRLLRAFEELLDAGHSLLVIEHNLDVIAAADWLIELGPEGGEGGGRLVCAGKPRFVSKHRASHTGAALRDYWQDKKIPVQRVSRRAAARAKRPDIRIIHAREHNLKNIDVTIPRNRFTVITGVSGSGKSTVAFDILFAEGQRRYLESLNAYARQFVQPAARPDVDAVTGIPPTVAIEQRTSRGGRKSTVATLTEIYHYLRLMFVKLGTQYCPDCDIPIEAQSMEAIHASILHDYHGRRIAVLAPLVTARKGVYNDLARWAAAKGYAHLRVDGDQIPTAPWPRLDRYREHHIELPLGELDVTPQAHAALRALLARALLVGNEAVKIIAAPARRRRSSRTNAGAPTETLFSSKRACIRCGRGYAELDPRLFSYNSPQGWCARCYGTGLSLSGFDAEASGEEAQWLEAWEGGERACPACAGLRLRPEALAVRFQKRSIAEYAAMPVAQAERVFGAMKLKGRAAELARDMLPELRARLRFLNEVGLSYLSLDRAAPTLSGGEAQRLRLAAQLGSNLRGVCYILDEPTIGLHPRDNRLMLDTLAALQRKGNTLVVVEHDEDTIRRADHVIDLGPGAGSQGGALVVAGSLNKIMREKRSVTGRYLARPLSHPLIDARRKVTRAMPSLEVLNAHLHNLRVARLRLPLERLVCVTGVSGSGKSTLVRKVLHDNIQRLLATRRGRKKALNLHGCEALEGWQAISRILEVNQAPIGKTPRSCPATYIGFWDAIRRLYAGTEEARLRGYGSARFSFNVQGGRCEGCAGQGVKRIEMSFLPDVEVPCEVCGGARFTPETLAVHYKAKNIGEVLTMSVDEAVEFFAAHVTIHHALKLLQDVGLGYLTLGQPSPTLSGGEAQRIKLVTELAKARQPLAATGKERKGDTGRSNTLYLLDEPTVGLHMADVEKLIRVLHRLVEAGNTVVVIEHNLDVVAEADWIIDLGPEGGDGGGRVVAQGTPETLARAKRATHTGRFLANLLNS